MAVIHIYFNIGVFTLFIALGKRIIVAGKKYALNLPTILDSKPILEKSNIVTIITMIINNFSYSLTFLKG